MQQSEVILEVKNIEKHFGGIIALDDISIDLYKGEILAIVGDNGAGKSTLIKIISGVYAQDKGDIYLENKKVAFKNPKQAKDLGIETVYQNLALVDVQDVPDNIFLGREIYYENMISKILHIMNRKKMIEESKKLIEMLGVNIKELHNPIRAYSGGQQQAVALSKIFYWGNKIAIMDEPTAALGVKESTAAINLIRKLKEKGLSILIISHNLEHVFAIADRIVILRRGKLVGIKKKSDINPEEVVKLITGADMI